MTGMSTAARMHDPASREAATIVDAPAVSVRSLTSRINVSSVDAVLLPNRNPNMTIKRAATVTRTMRLLQVGAFTCNAFAGG
jgi:hypothetical protein